MPAPAPTELLAEDIHDLRASNRDISAEIKGLQNGQASIQTELATIKTELKFIKWIGGFASTFLAGLILSAIALAWNASALNSEVKQQGSHLEKIEQQLSQVIQHIDAAPKSKP